MTPAIVSRGLRSTWLSDGSGAKRVGRRRTTRVFKSRLKQAKSRVQRFRRLRGVGLNVAHMARASITPAITYGADAMGLSCSALQQARSTVVAAAAPPGSGKSVDLVFHMTWYT